MKGARRRAIRIEKTPHALRRWQEIAGEGKRGDIEAEVRKKLLAELHASGVVADTSGMVRSPEDKGFLLRIRRNVWAVIRPEYISGWAVVTFHRGQKLDQKLEVQG